MANTLKFGAGKWATGNGTALAYNDENGNFKPIPFAFTRSSKATVVNQNGLVEEVNIDNPRIDFQDNAKGSMLLEPSRTNVVVHSNAMQSNGFSPIGTSIDADVTTSPDGTSNADLLKEDTANGSHFMYKDWNLTNGQTYTISVFVKSNGVNRNLRLGDGGVGWSNDFDSDFDLTNVTATNNGVIQSYGNGWYRCSVIGTTSASTSRLIVYNTLGNLTNYQGDGSSGLYLYGLQIEQGSYVTSLIPTEGSAVTRVADNCSRNSLQTGILESNTGTCYFEGFKNGQSVFFNVVLTDQTNTTKSFLIDCSGTSIRLRVWNASSSNQAVISTSSIADGVFKYLIKWNATNLKVFCNGSLVGTSSFTVYPYKTLYLIEGSSFSNNKLSDIKLYNTEITDAQAITLTSI